MEQIPLNLKIMKQEEESLANNYTASRSRNSMEREQNDTSDCNSPADLGTTIKNPVDNTLEREEHSEENESSGNANNQLVLYDPSIHDGGEIVPLSSEPPLRRSPFPFHSTSRVLPSVGAFTVQCANCFKWRLIPTKQKYEEIREHILEQPFVCETAREWRPSISCDDEPDIIQDGSRLWAIDKPNIAQPPPGWQRLLRIRGAGSTKFADVYVSFSLIILVQFKCFSGPDIYWAFQDLGLNFQCLFGFTGITSHPPARNSVPWLRFRSILPLAV